MHRMNLDTADSAMALAPFRLFVDARCWFGAMVPKRWARRAVTRNLVKRQIYTLFAQQENALPPAAYLVRLRSGFDRAEFQSAASAALRAAVRAELQYLLGRAARAPRVAT